MADSILRLKVDSQEYDSKLKRAAQGLDAYVRKCRDVGRTLVYVDDEAMKFVQALSSMDTVAKGGTQSLREITRTVTDLTLTYRSLTEEEKQSPFGEALAKSIQQLTERAGQARDAMNDVNAAIQHAASDTRIFDQIAGAAGLATSSFQTLQGAAKLLGIDLGDNVEVIAKLQAAIAVTNGLTQIQNALQKQSAVMQGLTAAKTTLAAAAQELYAVATRKATAAQAELNAVAKASPYVLIGTAIIGAVTALNHFSKEAQRAADEEERLENRQKEVTKQADNMRQSFVNTSSQAMNTASRLSSLQASYAAANSEIEKTSILTEAADEFKKLGLACNSLSDAQNILVNNGSAVIEMLRIQGNVAALSALRMEEYKKSFSTLLSNGYDVEGASILAGYNSTVQQLDSQITAAQTRIQAIQKGLPMSDGIGTTATATQPVTENKDLPIGSGAQLTQQLKDLQTAQSLVFDSRKWSRYQQQIEQIQFQIDALKGKWKDGMEVTFTFHADDAEVLEAARQIEGVRIDPKTLTVTADTTQAVEQLAALKGITLQPQTVTFHADDAEVLEATRQIEGVRIDPKTLTVTADTVEAYNRLRELTAGIDGTTVTFNVKPEMTKGLSIQSSAGLNQYINQLKQEIDQADLGSDLYNNLTSRLADATMLQNLLKESLTVGLGTALFDIANQTGQDFWDRVLSPEGVENADWQAISDVINQKRKELGLDPITLDFKTGKTSTLNNKENNSWEKTQQLTNGISQVNSGLQQIGIKLPDGVQKIVSATQGLITVINGIQTVIHALETSTVTAEVTALTTNTTALGALTAAIWANTTAQSGDAIIEAVKGVVELGAVAAMANGGIVPHAAHGYAVGGTHYSGDKTPILANAGEVILNRAQQGNLVSQLQDNNSESVTPSRSYVSGQDIFLGTNNYLKSSGQGEIVTTKMLRRMGIS